MKCVAFISGVAAGVAMAGMAVTAMYPDVSRRMTRDARRMCRCTRRAVEGMFV